VNPAAANPVLVIIAAALVMLAFFQKSFNLYNISGRKSAFFLLFMPFQEVMVAFCMKI